MGGVPARSRLADYRAISDRIGLSEHPCVPSRTTQDDGERPIPSLKVSILMCAFNEKQRIERATTEVLCTSYPCDIEHIVVDDGSKDDTALVAEKIIDPRLIVHRLSNNRGKGYALRCAAGLTTGTHILPVSYYSRSHAERKKINWRDAVACVAILVKVRLRRRKRLLTIDSDTADLMAGSESLHESCDIEARGKVDTSMLVETSS